MQITAKQKAFLLPSGSTFYKQAGIATEIRTGYLLKSPPSSRIKTEVTQSAQ